MKRSELFKGKISEYVIAFFAVFALFILFWVSGIKNNMYAARVFMTSAWIVLGAYAFWLKQKGKFDADAVLVLVMAAGMILGIGNMLGTHIFDKGYDQGYVNASARGHFGYILNLVEGHLPNGKEEQYYQPPLFHFAASIFVRLGLLLTGGNAEEAIQFTQIANCSVYCFLLIAVKNFIGELGIKEKYQPFVMAVIAFHPNFFLMGLRGNNDMFAAFFSVLCVINTYRWFKKRDMKTIIFLALSFGLGMMSKISVGVMAFFTGAVMVYCLVCDFREKKYKEIITQLAVFAVICIPLAMWYPIRNLILFDQPLGYVHRISETDIVYNGDIPLYKKFFEFSFGDVFNNPAVYNPEDYRILPYLIRSSVFGDTTYNSTNITVLLLLLANIGRMIAMPVSMIFVVVNKEKPNKKICFGFLAIWLLAVFSYVQFNIAYPYSCTANARYIYMSDIAGAVFIAYAMQAAKSKAFLTVLEISVFAFCICSALVYFG